MMALVAGLVLGAIVGSWGAPLDSGVAVLPRPDGGTTLVLSGRF